MDRAARPFAGGGDHRPEIEGLRGFAVIAVVLYHFSALGFSSGFLGVDIFFVISGFVITLALHRAPKVAAWRLLLWFYARRIKRLLPALVVCVALTALAFVAVTTRPPAETFKTGAFALLGMSNLHLWQLSQDYFAVDTQLNPFTQTWSLGVEEQIDRHA